METSPLPETAPSAPGDPRPALIRRHLTDRSLVLVGLMGCGKSTVGRRLAGRLGLPFVDVDTEIERAAGKPITEIFAQHGESYFRDGERRVIARLLRDNGAKVLATGGGAYMDADTRRMIAERGISVWLKAEFDVLARRVRKRSTRPLLRTADPDGTLRRLMDERYPVYALADLTVMSDDAPHEAVVESVVSAVADHIAGQPAPSSD